MIQQEAQCPVCATAPSHASDLLLCTIKTIITKIITRFEIFSRCYTEINICFATFDISQTQKQQTPFCSLSLPYLSILNLLICILSGWTMIEPWETVVTAMMKRRRVSSLRHETRYTHKHARRRYQHDSS